MTGESAPAPQLTRGAGKGRRRSEARAVLVAALVLLAGAAVGAGGFFVERAMSHWRPNLTRTADGWLIEQPGRMHPGDLALDGKRLAWRKGASIVLMDLRSGTLRLLGPGPTARLTWAPAVSRRYVVWFESATNDAETGAWAYDTAVRRRWRIATLGAALSPAAASGDNAVWCTSTDGAPRIVVTHIPSGRRSTVAGEYGEPVIDGQLVAWPSHPGRGRAPAAFSVADLGLGQRWQVVPGAALSGGDFLGLDLSGRTLAWGQSDPRSGADRVVAQDVDGGGATVVADGVALTAAPSISGDVVVWAQIGAGGDTLVMGRRLGAGEPFRIARVRGLVLAALVSGRTVAWLALGGRANAWVETGEVPR